jgi:hypothetical protein
MKVTVIGAAGGIGQPLSLLIKTQNPLVSSLSLYDVSWTPAPLASVFALSGMHTCMLQCVATMSTTGSGLAGQMHHEPLTVLHCSPPTSSCLMAHLLQAHVSWLTSYKLISHGSPSTSSWLMAHRHILHCSSKSGSLPPFTLAGHGHQLECDCEAAAASPCGFLRHMHSTALEITNP